MHHYLTLENKWLQVIWWVYPKTIMPKFHITIQNDVSNVINISSLKKEMSENKTEEKD